ncbi:TadE/TadG family type IV pilus assembly protein [Nocardioides terrigena]|uniref:TadE/TadG family type IV pilus assembly protein n=1 Tax=Nocardioides terrigena TaxID=424797 RepID=UPI00131F19E1|nr:TadE family protein [Nocardioides terrigena]
MEFALIVIPLLMIIAGVVNLGIAFAQQLALDNAVRQAARGGVVDTGKDTTSEVTTGFDNTALARSLAGAAAVSYPGPIATCEGSTFGQNLVVRARVETRFLFPWPLPGSVVPNKVTLTSQAEFQCEYQ